MDFSSILFGKPLNQLAYSDIEQFFAEEREESIHAEFKSFSTKHGNFQKNLEGVIRGICGFLNSEGGILVWGASEEERKDKTGEKAFQGKLSSLTEKKERDWLINKVSDSISPLPTGVNVAILESDGRFVYVFEVQVSNYSPHQYKNTYWARIDGQTKPAPHYLVEALFRKVRYPNVENFLKIDSVTIDGEELVMDITVFVFNFSKLQNEEKVTLDITCDKGQFAGSREPVISWQYTLDGYQNSSIPVADVLHYGKPARHEESLVFSLFGLMTLPDDVNIFISHGGKYSPAKMSMYEIDFRRFRDADQNMNELFVSIRENLLAAEEHERTGATREEMLKAILERSP